MLTPNTVYQTRGPRQWPKRFSFSLIFRSTPCHSDPGHYFLISEFWSSVAIMRSVFVWKYGQTGREKGTKVLKLQPRHCFYCTLERRSVTSSLPSAVTATPLGQTCRSAMTEQTLRAMSTSRRRCPTESATTNEYGPRNATSHGSSIGFRAPAGAGHVTGPSVVVSASGTSCHSRTGFVSRSLIRTATRRSPTMQSVSGMEKLF